ncbi:hypothetical protein CNY89_21370, partial [Amaricoccus sp. HAR-UPW-R2A-40]
DALLSPWKDMSPDHDLKSYLTAKINALYGHPRIGRYKAVWNETSAAAQAIFQRWLTGENIRFFLDVVTTVEKATCGSHGASSGSGCMNRTGSAKLGSPSIPRRNGSQDAGPSVRACRLASKWREVRVATHPF